MGTSAGRSLCHALRYQLGHILGNCGYVSKVFGKYMMIDEILLYNKKFVAEKAYEPYVTDKFPAKKLAVLTCMDTRLTEIF